MMIELFTVQQTIASCSSKDITFDCMLGPDRDVTNVIISSDTCNSSRLATYKCAKTAYHPNGNGGHSNYTGGIWSSSNGLYYYVPTSAVGLLAICAVESGQGKDKTTTYTPSEWSLSNGVLTHTSGIHSRTGKHCRMAPVYNYKTMNTGS